MENNFKAYYFLGIGGIGMSALARYFSRMGNYVMGYDKTSTELTTELASEGIHIHFEDDISFFLAKGFKKEEVLVILTPAVPANHSELNFFKANNYTIKKRAEVLGLLCSKHQTAAVAGTHGKTTTSSMIAHILNDCGKDVIAFLGGISKNFSSNLLMPVAEKLENSMVVAEADEYDRSFLQLFPDVAVITSMDPDHLDIYGNHSEMMDTYRKFASQVKKDLIVKKGLPVDIKHHSYSVSEGDFHAKNIHVHQHHYAFDIVYPEGEIKDIQLDLPGQHNVENAIAAFAVCWKMGVEPERIGDSISRYEGVKRRFDYQIKRNEVVYIDDYAHHPEELRACISAAKELYPGKKITGVFQPHLFTRTRDFVDGFAESLSLLDELVLMDIYPARELPIQGITSQIIIDKMNVKNVELVSKEDLMETLTDKDIEVLLTLGAGDIDVFVEPIRNMLVEKYCNASQQL